MTPHAAPEHLFSAEERATDEREETCAHAGCKNTMESVDVDAGEFFCFHMGAPPIFGHCHLHVPEDCFLKGSAGRTDEERAADRKNGPRSGIRKRRRK